MIIDANKGIQTLNSYAGYHTLSAYISFYAIFSYDLKMHYF